MGALKIIAGARNIASNVSTKKINKLYCTADCSTYFPLLVGAHFSFGLVYIGAFIARHCTPFHPFHCTPFHPRWNGVQRKPQTFIALYRAWRYVYVRIQVGGRQSGGRINQRRLAHVGRVLVLECTRMPRPRRSSAGGGEECVPLERLLFLARFI